VSDGSGGITSSSNFTYNVGDNVLTLFSSISKVNSITVDTISAGQLIQSFTTDTGCAAIFEYCVTESGGAKRMGQIYAVWDNATATHTDVASPDLNSSTANYIWKVDVSGGSLELTCAINGGTWNVLVSTRIIF
jgi:hypothetical protein